jgi:DNA-binding XRE family transcriptional regulator
MRLGHLATVLGVSEMTLRNAARSGRLRIQDMKLLPGKPVLRATREDGEDFLANRFGRKLCLPQDSLYQTSLSCRNATNVPEQIRRLRTKLRLSQRDFARLIGAANRAVVYQWESAKRRPSSALWVRLVALGVNC